MFFKKQFVTPSGFEPETYALEERCSIQLSYGAIILESPKITSLDSNAEFLTSTFVAGDNYTCADI